METGKQGWKYLFNATKQHYFKQGRSLCGRWMTFGHGDCIEDNGKPQHDECISCRSKLTPELAPKPKKRKQKINESMLGLADAFKAVCNREGI